MTNWLRRLYAIMLKELIQLSRERMTIGMIIGVPLLQVLLFGYAINNDIRNLPTAIFNESNSHLSRQFISELAQTQILKIKQHVHSMDELQSFIRHGEIAVGLYIPHDFDRRSLDNDRSMAQLLVDGADPTVGGVAGRLANVSIRFDSIQVANNNAPTLDIRTYFNPTRRTAVNIIPGLIGLILTLTMTMFTAVAIVREKERGNIELLINTPITTTQLMIGKVIPYIAIGLIQVALIVFLGKTLFHVPMRGHFLDLYLAATMFIAANLSIGLLISTAAKTQFQAMQLTIMLILPSILISGFLFPFEGMPLAAQYLGELLPNTHFTRLSRGIMLRGADISELHKDLATLAIFFVITMTLSVLRFSRRLD
jgi:ABC-2 type transport system permease protein